MADENVTQPVTTKGNTAQATHDDLLVTITSFGASEFRGTAEQLTAEGLIPNSFEWPDRAHRVTVTVGNFSHWIGRARPPGLKGPMKLWTGGDYWLCRRELEGQSKTFLDIRIEEKAREIKHLIWCQTPASHDQFNRLCTARYDKAFQAFKARVIPEKPKGGGRSASAKTDDANHV